MTKNDLISIIIPTRNPKSIITDFSNQTYKNFEVIIIHDEKLKGAPWARNQGAKKAKGQFLLFSDDDIIWKPYALELLLKTLKEHPECSYSYGAYLMDGVLYCWQEFDSNLLKQRNYISTMSLIRRQDFPRFDENLKRLQDWDLWLNLLFKNKIGVFCKDIIFTTFKRAGITFGPAAQSWEDAVKAIKLKYKI